MNVKNKNFLSLLLCRESRLILNMKVEREVRVVEESIQEVQKKLAVAPPEPQSQRPVCPNLSNLVFLWTLPLWNLAQPKQHFPGLNPGRSAAAGEHLSCLQQAWGWRVWWPRGFGIAHRLPGDVEAQMSEEGCVQVQAKACAQARAQERPEKTLSSHILLILALQSSWEGLGHSIHYLPEDWSVFGPDLKERTAFQTKIREHEGAIQIYKKINWLKTT